MSKLTVKGCNGCAINSFADWASFAIPQARREKQWKAGRSAYELGKRWTAFGKPSLPLEVQNCLDSHPATSGINFEVGYTEKDTKLPFGRMGRNHDLVLHGRNLRDHITVCIEAKSDEPYDKKVETVLANARAEAAKRPNGSTKFPERLEWLSQSLLGKSAFENAQLEDIAGWIGTLRYQLFAAFAGTLIEASLRGSNVAVLLVHEFRTSLTVETNLTRNSNDLNAFLKILVESNSMEWEDHKPGWNRLVGPLRILERQVNGSIPLPTKIDLYLGKVFTDSRP